MPLQILSYDLPDWGTAYRPAGEGPFPAILILHGSEGGWSGWSHLTAALFAAHGYFAFPLNYTKGGNAWNAGSISDVPLERTAEALAILRRGPFRSGRVGLYGVSRGAEHALLLTALLAKHGLAEPHAVAVHAAPDVICGGFDAREWRDAGDPGWQSWDPSKRAWSWQGKSDNLLPTTAIEIEHYEGPIFLSHGTADQTWSVAMTRRLEDRLRAYGRTPVVHYYDGQDHTPSADAENAHHLNLLSFFNEHLSSRNSLSV